MEKIWFTADTHFGHRNVLKHCPGRSEFGGYDIDDVEAHDRWLMDIWNTTVGKKDTVYIIGDFSFLPKEGVRKLLCKLNAPDGAFNHFFRISFNHFTSSSDSKSTSVAGNIVIFLVFFFVCTRELNFLTVDDNDIITTI